MNNYFQRRREKPTFFNDLEAIRVIELGLPEENAVLEFLYRTTSTSLCPYILSNHGSRDDAEDVLQDAIIIFYEKVKSQDFRLQTTIAGYIYAVGRYMWLNTLRKRKLEILVSDRSLGDVEVPTLEIEVYKTNVPEYTQMLLDKLHNGCKKILIDSIYKKIPMKEIAKTYGLKNEQIARNKKYKCLKSLRNIIEKSPYFSRLLTEIDS